VLERWVATIQEAVRLGRRSVPKGSLLGVYWGKEREGRRHATEYVMNVMKARAGKA